MGTEEPKDMKSKIGPIVKYIAYGVFIFALVTTLKVACEHVPQPPKPPLMWKENLSFYLRGFFMIYGKF